MARLPLLTALTALLIVTPAVGLAQEPVCPPAPADHQYYTGCRPEALLPTIRFLSEFSVDHLFKPAPPPFRRTLLDFARPLARSLLARSKGLEEYLASLDELRFTQLDRATGVLSADFTNASRSYSTSIEFLTGTRKFSLQLPERLEGGYWRAPTALQLAFWKNKRASFTAELGDQALLSGEVSCLALSPDGLRLVLSGARVNGVMIFFRNCR